MLNIIALLHLGFFAGAQCLANAVKRWTEKAKPHLFLTSFHAHAHIPYCHHARKQYDKIGTVRDCFGESLKENKAKKAKVEENCGTRPSKRRSGLKVKTNRPATPGERLGHQGVRVSEKYCKYTQTQKETILRIHQAHDLRVPAPSSTTYEPTPCLTLVDLVGFGVVYATHRANMVETLH